MSKCEARTNDGRPCAVRPLRGGSFCFNHDPAEDTAALRDDARRAGGRARGAQLHRAADAGPPDPLPSWWRLATVNDAIGAYGWLVREIVSGSVDARTANALSAALGGFVNAVREGELERRLDMVEAAVGTRGRSA